ncbi:hypothetical protein K7X08_006315 [Anisodus acutangulus]|uniref:Uncharacterized protein n=1 Tax=Anisodus acutangulus TaxID=402998 RepID=A0A9Q1MZG0_9SOLA|nr:hypothetical protein K7X08_006315 [Anisodus acutangulus]
MTYKTSDQYHSYQPYSTSMYNQPNHHFEKDNSSKEKLKVHKLIDAPPYPSIGYTSNGFEASSKEELKVHKLIDAPPYPSIRYTSNGFEAFRNEKEENVSKERPEYSWNSNVYVDRQDGRYGELVYEEAEEEEDVDAEANAFIKWKHNKFNRDKWLSTKSFY